MADQQAPQNLGGNLSSVQAINLGSALSTPPATAGPDLLPSYTGNGTAGAAGAQGPPGFALALTFPSLANFPDPTVNQSAFAIDLSTNALYLANAGAWWIIAKVGP